MISVLYAIWLTFDYIFSIKNKYKQLGAKIYGSKDFMKIILANLNQKLDFTHHVAW